MIFAICVVGGTIAGGKYRYSWAVMEVPWGDKEEDVPSSPQEAWMWISFANDALALGVSADEIKTIYRKTKRSDVPIDKKNLPWPSYSRMKQPAKKGHTSTNQETNTDEQFPPPRPGASPR